jgi:hypothetical protein
VSNSKIVDRVKSSQGLSFSQIIPLQDQVSGLRGSVKCITEDFINGEWQAPVIAHEKHNLIVNGARKALAHLIAEAPANYRITQFKLGTGGHGVDILTPVSPTINDTDLETPVFTKNISSFQYLPSGAETSVEFTIVVDLAEANGGGVVAYTEAGLLCADGVTLFARETFPAVVKNANRRISFIWSILF